MRDNTDTVSPSKKVGLLKKTFMRIFKKTPKISQYKETEIKINITSNSGNIINQTSSETDSNKFPPEFIYILGENLKKDIHQRRIEFKNKANVNDDKSSINKKNDSPPEIIYILGKELKENVRELRLQSKKNINHKKLKGSRIEF